MLENYIIELTKEEQKEVTTAIHTLKTKPRSPDSYRDGKFELYY